MNSGPVGFDLDMTLIDSRPQILASFQAMSDETGVAIDLDVVQARFGLKLEDELAYWFSPGDADAAAATYRRHYLQLATQTTPLPGAHEALACVRDSGRPTAIITAKHGTSVGPCLDAARISADTVHAFAFGAEKAEALREIGAVMYIGDTPHDIEAALHAGVIAVGVATGAFTSDQLREAGATAVLPSLLQFPLFYAALDGHPES